MPQLTLRTCIRSCLFAIVTLLFVHSNSLSANDESWPNSNNDTVSSGTLFLNQSSGDTEAPVLRADVNIDVSGIVAAVEVTQSFINISDEWVEGLYTFPLAERAAVNSLEVLIGDRRIVGRIKEKADAKRIYNAAKANGQVASLVDQHRPNLFSSRFANIAPGERITITLRYIQTIAYENGHYSMRVPLTLTPRYSNHLVEDAAEITSEHITAQQLYDQNLFKQDEELQGEQPHAVTITGVIHTEFVSGQVTSPSHAIDTGGSIQKTTFSLKHSATLDRDFILEWTTANSTQPSVQYWREQVGQDTYLLASVTPAAQESSLPDFARELIIVIDTSGSMAGTSMSAAKKALKSALAGLKDDDKFNIIAFDDGYSALFVEPQYANSSNLSAGRWFTNRLQANGGTNMMPALEEALSYQQSQMLRQVVFITDGSVGYEESVIETLSQQLRNARLFTVGIGSAPNDWFMRKVAEAGRGSSVFIGDERKLQATMASLLRKLESPVLTNINVEFDDQSSDYVPKPIPDLYADEPVVIAAKLGSATTNMRISGQWGDTLFDETISLVEAPFVNTGLSTVWARRKIESLEDKQRFHPEPEFYKSTIKALALEHQLLSRYTSFVAVEDTPVRTQDNLLIQKTVPNQLPAGNEMHAINFPQGAAGSDTLIVLSLLSALLAFFVRFYTQIALICRAVRQ